MGWTFEGFELDLDGFELRSDGVGVPIEPQVFEVLAHLVVNHGRLVTKEELLDAVWGDRFVSESALTSRIKAARRAIGDDGQAQRLIRTVHGRGYRFVADVLDADPGPGADSTSPSSGPGGDLPPMARHNLPGERTPLLGRERDIAAVTALLRDHRLVSLLGMGGMGKTRLAAAVGRSMLDEFADGVWFVDLLPVRDARALEVAVADAIGIALDAGPVPPQLAVALRSRDALVILDNCEHVLVDVARLVDGLLEETERLRFLATSRRPLDLPDERRVQVDPLTVAGEGGDAPAVAMFVAVAERLGVEIPEEEFPSVTEICRHLDGLPLAIEVAAAQLRQLTVAELVDRLDRRFELRAAGHAAERQSSLGAVLSGTWGLMPEAERELICQLAAFPGGFSASDVEALWGDAPPADLWASFTALADHSLVVREPRVARGHRLLESVRLFARQSIDEDAAAVHADRHAQWLLDHVGDSVTLPPFDYGLAVWGMGRHEDLRAAEEWLLERDRANDAARLAAGAALSMHIDDGARASEMLERIDRLIADVDDPTLVSRMRITAVMCGMAIRSPEVMREHGELAIAHPCGDAVVDSIALVLASWTELADGERALELLGRAEELATSAGDDRARAFAVAYRGWHLATLRRYDDAIEVLAEFQDPHSTHLDYPSLAGQSACRACAYLTDPTDALAWVQSVIEHRQAHVQMWAHHVVEASILAANEMPIETAAKIYGVRERLHRAGRDGLPDLLVPVAVLAHQLGDDRRADRWLRAVRAAGRPTQSFQVTVLYRRLREVVAPRAEDGAGAPAGDLAAAADEAFAWLEEVAAASRRLGS